MSNHLDPTTLRTLAGRLDLGVEMVTGYARTADSEAHQLAYESVGESYRTLATGYRQLALEAEAAEQDIPEDDAEFVERVADVITKAIVGGLAALSFAAGVAVVALAWWGAVSLWGWVT